jgi:seryl-tRNA synthetase
MDRVISLACAEHSGHYSLEIPNGISVDDRVRKLKQVEKLQQEKSELQGKLKKEKNLGTQVQLNTRIKQITDRIEAIKNEL